MTPADLEQAEHELFLMFKFVDESVTSNEALLGAADAALLSAPPEIGCPPIPMGDDAFGDPRLALT